MRHSDIRTLVERKMAHPMRHQNAYSSFPIVINPWYRAELRLHRKRGLRSIFVNFLCLTRNIHLLHWNLLAQTKLE